MSNSESSNSQYSSQKSEEDKTSSESSILSQSDSQKGSQENSMDNSQEYSQNDSQNNSQKYSQKDSQSNSQENINKESQEDSQSSFSSQNDEENKSETDEDSSATDQECHTKSDKIEGENKVKVRKTLIGERSTIPSQVEQSTKSLNQNHPKLSQKTQKHNSSEPCVNTETINIEQNRLSIELDDQMIKFVERFRGNEVEFEKYIRYDKDFDFYNTFLLERITDIQSNPMKYSDKDFEIIDRMVKLMTDQHNEQFFIESRDITAFSRSCCQIICNLFKLEKEEHIEKYKNLPVTYYRYFYILALSRITEKYEILCSIFESLFQKCEIIERVQLCNFPNHNNDFPLKLFKSLSKAQFIIFVHFKGWQNITKDQEFAGMDFSNLKKITLSFCDIYGCELNRVCRFLSTNQSIQSNLESFRMKMVEVIDEDFLFILLKIKSYGFKQCILWNFIHSLDGPKIGIEASKQKITPIDINCILYLILLYFSKSRNLKSTMDFIECLEFFEFEDENDRQQFEYHNICKYIETFQTNLKSKDIAKYFSNFDSITRDYFYIRLVNIDDKIENKEFPPIEKYSMIRTKTGGQFGKSYFMPYLEFKSIFYNSFTFSDSFIMKLGTSPLFQNCEMSEMNRILLEVTHKLIREICQGSEMKLKIITGEIEYIDNLECFSFICQAKKIIEKIESTLKTDEDYYEMVKHVL